MNTLLDVYEALNTDDRLSFCDHTLILRIDDFYQLVAYDNNGESYIELKADDTQFYHMHLDYDETKEFFLKVMHNRKPLPTPEEYQQIRKYESRSRLQYLLIPLFVMVFFVLFFQSYCQTILSKICLLLLPLIGSIAIIRYFDKQYKKKYQSLFDKVSNLEFK